MNRSLLLVICDFLLLSLLALARFDEPAPEEPETIVEEAVQEASIHEDMIEVLRLSLEAERDNRGELTEQLEETQKALEEREQILSRKEENLEQTQLAVESLENEKKRLEAEQQALSAARKQLEREKQLALQEKATLDAQFKATQERLSDAEVDRLELAKNLGELKEQTAASTERLKFLQAELQKKQSALEESEETKKRLEQERRVVELEKQTLATQLQVAETETKVMEQTLQTARADIEASREERMQIQEHANALAEGVTVLAESTDQIREEVKQLQPQSLNTIFSQFKQNRLTLRFKARRSGLLSEKEETYPVQTILVTDGANTFAIMHIAETPFGKGGLKSVSGTLYLGGQAYRISQVGFLLADPRIVVTAVPASMAEAAGITPFALAAEPLRFPQAVLIDSEENYYGESDFKLLARSDRYMRMETNLVSRLFGEFSPKRSDLVFAKTGEFMGLMVNREFCVLLQSLTVSGKLGLGDNFSEAMGGRILERQKGLVERLPRDIR